MKVALAHDDFCQLGGAERLFAQIAKIYPEAPIYTSLVNWDKIPVSINPKRIRTSFIQKIPYAQKFYKALLPLYPLAFESFNFNEFDLIISSTTRFAKSILTKPQSAHICYVNSIPRFIWENDKKENYIPKIIAPLATPYLKWLARWDKASAQRVDFYIANSKNVQEKIKDIYRRESVIIYPYADTTFYKPKEQNPSKDYYLVVSRLTKWKKIDIAIKAACLLGFNLKIVGEGPDRERLKSVVSGNQKSGKVHVEFLSNVSKEELRDLYQNTKALIVTQEEDFGIAAVEAQSCGIPVIAYVKGGTVEIIKENKTGLTFKNQTPESLKDAIGSAAIVKWDHGLCRTNALRFSKANFRKELAGFINNATKSR